MNLSKLMQLAQTVGTLSAVITVLALMVGGRFALKRYRREVLLRAADLLLQMEEEYRIIVRTCLEFEFLQTYQRTILPVLQKVQTGTLSAPEDIEMLHKLDRCLRFFFLCTVLSSDLQVEETAIARSYYFYLSILAEPGKRVELQQYLSRNYKRLDAWMKRHRDCLDRYRETGEWNWALVKK
jgi:hypothetical protein